MLFKALLYKRRYCVLFNLSKIYILVLFMYSYNIYSYFSFIHSFHFHFKALVILLNVLFFLLFSFILFQS